MEDHFLRHNLYKQDPQKFLDEDPHLAKLPQLEFVHELNWWAQIDWNTPGIFLLTGGRQIGKSTSLKLLLKHFLTTSQRFNHGKNMFYLSCDLIFEPSALLQALQIFLNNANNNEFLLLLDEITFVKHWDRVIKGLADEGRFTNGFCIITGSDSYILKEATLCFPGRRGMASKTDFHLFPLSFAEYVQLVQKKHQNSTPATMMTLFLNFLNCGGFLRAINDWHKHGKILEATFTTFEQWIRGDFMKRGKHEEFLKTVLQTLCHVGVSQTSYSSLTQKAGRISKQTFIDYCTILQRMDILLVFEALDQNTKLGFPKKNHKFHFNDPFILRTLERWLIAERFLNAEAEESARVEACVASQVAKLVPAYYGKFNGEIDIMAVVDNKILPIEIKWSNQLRPNDIKELQKFKQSLVLSKYPVTTERNGLKQIYLPDFLSQMQNQASLQKYVASESITRPQVTEFEFEQMTPKPRGLKINKKWDC